MLERVSNLMRSNVPRSRGLRTMLAAALLTVATYAAAAQMRGDHPDSYVVKRGDTLWDISARFLKKPRLWPEIWQANPQIKNAALIYVGQKITIPEGSPLKSLEARLFYAQQAAAGQLGVRDLRQLIARKAFDRTAIADTQLAPNSPVPPGAFKDRYLFDFLGL